MPPNPAVIVRTASGPVRVERDRKTGLWTAALVGTLFPPSTPCTSRREAVRMVTERK